MLSDLKAICTTFGLKYCESTLKVSSFENYGYSKMLLTKILILLEIS